MGYLLHLNFVVCDALALTRRTVRLYPHHDRIYQRSTVLRIFQRFL